GKYMPVEEKENTTYKIFSATDTTGYTPSKFYVLNDGSIFFANSGQNWEYKESFEIIYDINGEKAPNTKGKDVFIFEIRDIRTGGWSDDYSKLWVCAGTWCPNTNVSKNRENYKKNCSSGAMYSCTVLIEADGWEVKDDYPLL
ncbi:MAG: hypothetical protein LUG16_08305, partial [Candidatus Gastranaerophilales bacterium]|nr:hypothetical protein [Candidatus Gastranaerophilales bacterium]